LEITMNYPYQGDSESWDSEDSAPQQRLLESERMAHDLAEMRELVRAGLPQWLWRSMSVREAAAVAWLAQLPDPTQGIAEERRDA
jgi:hypothetical protein